MIAILIYSLLLCVIIYFRKKINMYLTNIILMNYVMSGFISSVFYTNKLLSDIHKGVELIILFSLIDITLYVLREIPKTKLSVKQLMH